MLSGARQALAKAILQIIIAPFGSVRFRDFFLADVITSMGQPLIDAGLISCYFKQGHW